MAKQRRPVAPFSEYHAVVRRAEGLPLFLDDQDRRKWLKIISIAIERYDITVLAFVLMLNHAHLVLRTRLVSVSRVFHYVDSAYASFFNWKYAHQGHVFGREFLSKRITSDAYRRVAIVYTHRNPVAAGAQRPVGTSWSPWNSHGALLGIRAPGILDREQSLLAFGQDEKEALDVYRKQFAAACEEYGPFEELFPSNDVTASEVALRVDEDEASLAVEGAVLRLRAALCDVADVPISELKAGRRTTDVSRVRAAIAFRAERDFRSPRAELARALGVSEAAIVDCIARGRAAARELGVLNLEIPGVLRRVR